MYGVHDTDKLSAQVAYSTLSMPCVAQLFNFTQAVHALEQNAWQTKHPSRETQHSSHLTKLLQLLCQIILQT